LAIYVVIVSCKLAIYVPMLILMLLLLLLLLQVVSVIIPERQQ
jgi:hypothetical protein